MDPNSFTKYAGGIMSHSIWNDRFRSAGYIVVATAILIDTPYKISLKVLHGV